MSYILNSLYGNFLFTKNAKQAISYIVKNDTNILAVNESEDPNDHNNWLKVFCIGISRLEMQPLSDGKSDLVKWIYSDEIEDSFAEGRWACLGDNMEARKIKSIYSSWGPDIIFARFRSLDLDIEEGFSDLLATPMENGLSVFLICDNGETLDDIRKRMIKKPDLQGCSENQRANHTKPYSLNEAIEFLKTEHPVGLVELN